MYHSKNQVFLVIAFLCTVACSYVQCVPSLNYIAVGCYKDTANRAIPILEGKDPILDGHYSHRLNAIGKCAVAALKKKYRIFAVQHGGQCFGGANAERTFHKYGKSTSCGKDGEGGAWANQVYLTKGYVSVGCYKDTGLDRAISTLEGKDPILDGAYWLRANPTAKCAVAAIKRGYHMFAVQNSGWCAASKTAPNRFDKHGPSKDCWDGGEGGPWANEVYYIVPK